MDMNAFLMEKATFKQAGVPVDLNTAGLTGARIKLDKGFRLAVVVNMGDSTAAVVSVALKQHNAASAGTSKALSVANKYFKKAGAATSFTQVEPTVAADTYDIAADFADAEGIAVFEVLAEDLDVNNGFAWFSVEMADSTAAKLAGVMYVVHEVKNFPAYSAVL